jgi:hypothetical protein
MLYVLGSFLEMLGLVDAALRLAGGKVADTVTLFRGFVSFRIFFLSKLLPSTHCLLRIHRERLHNNRDVPFTDPVIDPRGDLFSWTGLAELLESRPHSWPKPKLCSLRATATSNQLKELNAPRCCLLLTSPRSEVVHVGVSMPHSFPSCLVLNSVFQNAVYFLHLVNLLLLLPAYGPPPFFLTICRAL